MKNIISAALLCAIVSSPAFAEDAKPKTPAKPAPHPMMGQKCDAEHGMMGQHGMMGPQGMMMGQQGMMGMHMLGALDLSDEQRSKITKLTDEFSHDNWAKQGKMNDESAKLRDLYEADRRDPAAIGREYQQVFEIKRQMIESYLEVQNRIEDVLTPEQRAKLKELRGKMHHMYMQR